MQSVCQIRSRIFLVDSACPSDVDILDPVILGQCLDSFINIRISCWLSVRVVVIIAKHYPHIGMICLHPFDHKSDVSACRTLCGVTCVEQCKICRPIVACVSNRRRRNITLNCALIRVVISCHDDCSINRICRPVKRCACFCAYPCADLTDFRR